VRNSSTQLTGFVSSRAKVSSGQNSVGGDADGSTVAYRTQIREYILQQERIDEARRQQARIGEAVRRERRKWEIQLGYFILAGVAVVVFALNEYFHNKSGQMVLIVLGSGALAFLGALIYVNGFLWVTEKLGYKTEPRGFSATMTSTGIVFFALWAAWAYTVFSGRH
jgi:VIT1/CCC1 family predicted Fe2+/Mn2+ transporter